MAPSHNREEATGGVDLNPQRNPRGIFKGTREEWLEQAAEIMGEWLNHEFTAVRVKNRKKFIIKSEYQGNGRATAYSNKKVRISCSLLSRGMKQGKALAHCHYAHATGNNFHEIRMGAHVGGRGDKYASVRVADILLHEMIHTMFPYAGHKGAFRDMAKAIGMEGKMTATYASKALNERIETGVVKVLGRYPHKGVKLEARGTTGSRLIKCTCESCGCIIRLTRKWIAVAEGEVSCPVCQEGMILG